MLSLMMIEDSVPNSGMITDGKTCYSARYIPPDEHDTAHLVVSYSNETYWFIDITAQSFQQMFRDQIFSKDHIPDTTVGLVFRSDPLSINEESLCSQLVNAAKSNEEVSLAAIFSSGETLQALSLTCGGSADEKFNVSKSVWSFGSNLSRRDPAELELKRLFRFIPSDAIVVTVKGEGGKMVQKVFICNTVIKLSEGGTDRFILLQVMREMCNDFLLHFVLLNMRTNEVSMTRVKQPALFTCLLTEEISAAQLASAAKAYRIFLTVERMIYARKYGINASNKSFRSLIESNVKEGANQIIDDEKRYHAVEFKDDGPATVLVGLAHVDQADHQGFAGLDFHADFFASAQSVEEGRRGQDTHVAVLRQMFGELGKDGRVHQV
jgi:hypothetical protein